MTATATASIAKSRLTSAIAIDRAAREAQAVVERAKVQARAHEVTRPSRHRKLARDWGSANSIVGMDARQLRDQARHLERDLDIADNALNVLVQNTVGSGIDVLAAPRLPGQPINRALAEQVDDLWDGWWDAPEVTGMHDYGACQQLLCRTWMRDGESYYQDLIGTVPGLVHGTQVPYSIEMIEPDLIPLDMIDPARNILQGVEKNAWGRAVAYHVYKTHPGDAWGAALETKRVSADVLHGIRNTKRLHQVRGLSVFASAMSRFEDVKDYEESERIAAKVAASMCAYIKKGNPDRYGENPGGVSTQIVLPHQGERDLRFTAGMIFDDLLTGEEIGTVDTNRPNPNAANWRMDQLRAAAGGIGVSYSSLTRNYDGTYSAQRQELVEQWGGYLMLAERFIALAVRKHRLRFIEAAVLAGKLRLPRGWQLRHLAASTYVRPVMPWIDPLKEAYGRGEAEDRGWTSPQQNTLLYGNNPNDVERERADWAARRTELGDAPQPAPATAQADRSAIRAASITAALRD